MAKIEMAVEITKEGEAYHAVLTLSSGWKAKFTASSKMDMLIQLNGYIHNRLYALDHIQEPESTN